MKNNSRFILIAVLLVVALVLGGWVVSQYFNQEEDISDIKDDENIVADEEIREWNTFTSSLEDYSFKYPKEWDIEIGDVRGTPPYQFETVTITGSENFQMKFDATTAPRGWEDPPMVRMSILHENPNGPDNRPIYFFVTRDNSDMVSAIQASEFIDPEDLETLAPPPWISGEKALLTISAKYLSDEVSPQCPSCGFLPQKIPYYKFIEKPEVKTAIKIFESLEYK